MSLPVKMGISFRPTLSAKDYVEKVKKEDGDVVGLLSENPAQSAVEYLKGVKTPLPWFNSWVDHKPREVRLTCNVMAQKGDVLGAVAHAQSVFSQEGYDKDFFVSAIEDIFVTLVVNNQYNPQKHDSILRHFIDEPEELQRILATVHKNADAQRQVSGDLRPSLIKGMLLDKKVAGLVLKTLSAREPQSEIG